MMLGVLAMDNSLILNARNRSYPSQKEVINVFKDIISYLWPYLVSECGLV